MRIRQTRFLIVGVIAFLLISTLTLGFKLRPQSSFQDRPNRFNRPSNFGANFPFRNSRPLYPRFGMNDDFPLRNDFQMPFRDDFPFQHESPFGDDDNDEFNFKNGIPDLKSLPKGDKNSYYSAEGRTFSSEYSYDSRAPEKNKNISKTTSWKYESLNGNLTSQTLTTTNIPEESEITESEGSVGGQIPLFPASKKEKNSSLAQEATELSEEAETNENSETSENSKTASSDSNCNYPDAYICQDSDRNKNISAVCSTIGYHSCVCYNNGTCLSQVANKCYSCANPAAISIHQGDNCPNNCTKIQGASSEEAEHQVTGNKNTKKRLLL